MSVVLDFTDELQTAILQVKLNLSREYERQKLAHAKSFQGQQDDLDRLNEGFQEQDQLMADILSEMQESGTEWKDDQLKELEELLKVFDGLDANGVGEKLTGLEGSVQANENFKRILAGKKFAPLYNPTKIVDGMKGVSSSKAKKDGLAVAQVASQLKKSTVQDIPTKVEKQSSSLKKQVDGAKVQTRVDRSQVKIEVQGNVHDEEPSGQKTAEPSVSKQTQVGTEPAKMAPKVSQPKQAWSLKGQEPSQSIASSVSALLDLFRPISEAF